MFAHSYVDVPCALSACVTGTLCFHCFAADVLRGVLSYLDGASVARFEMTSKGSRDTARSKHVWKRALFGDFLRSASARYCPHTVASFVAALGFTSTPGTLLECFDVSECYPFVTRTPNRCTSNGTVGC